MSEMHRYFFSFAGSCCMQTAPRDSRAAAQCGSEASTATTVRVSTTSPGRATRSCSGLPMCCPSSRINAWVVTASRCGRSPKPGSEAGNGAAASAVGGAAGCSLGAGLEAG